MNALRQILILILLIALIGFGGCSWFSAGLGFYGLFLENGNGYSIMFVIWGAMLAAVATGIFFLIRAVWIMKKDTANDQTGDKH